MASTIPEGAGAAGRPAPEPSFAQLAEIAPCGVYLVDTQRRIVSWNRSAEEISGWPAEAVVDRRCYDAILRHTDGRGHLLCRTACPLVRSMGRRSGGSGRVWLHHRDGHRVEVEVRVQPVLDERGRVTGAIETFHPVQPEVESAFANELRELALTDQLTGLANRRMAQSRLEQRLEDLRAHGISLGVIMADLDHFKALNDEYGHAAGDAVLRVAADTLRSSVRSVDLACRWGGEEFLVLLHGADLDATRAVAERFLALLRACEIPYGGQVLRVTASAGATAAEPGEHGDAVLRRADALLYQAKAGGRARVAG